MANLVRQLPFGTTIEGKKNGAFVAMTLQSKLYKNYGDPTVDPEQVVDIVVMCQRWDGLQGLIGGFVDPGESIEDCAVREVSEEVNFPLQKQFLEPLATHELNRVVVHAFHVNLSKDGKLWADRDVKNLFRGMSHAKHLIVEGNPIFVHMKTYDKWGKGFKNTINSNTLASAVKEELEILAAKLGIPIEYPNA